MLVVACVGHWWVSLLYLAPVVMVMAVVTIVARIERRREEREESPEPAPQGGALGMSH
jgi:cytochrome c-type biogenesis protein CcmH/NrfF